MATLKHIRRHDMHLPYDDPEVLSQVPKDCVLKPPKGMKRQQDGKYWISLPGLRLLLSNVTYLGHWMFKGQIVKENNHDPIVPLDLFMASFNYLSPVLFDGSKNPDYLPHRGRIRKDKNTASKRPEKPFLEGIIFCRDQDGNPQHVTCTWTETNTTPKPSWYYVASERTEKYTRKMWTKTASAIDNVAHGVLQSALYSTTKNDALNSVVDGVFDHELMSERRLCEKQLKIQQQKLKNLIGSVASFAHIPNVIAGINEEIAEVSTEQTRLEKRIDEIDTLKNKVEQLEDLRRNTRYWFNNYFRMPLELRRLALEICIEKVIASVDRNDIVLVFYFVGGETIESRIARFGDGWTNSAIERLTSMVESGANQVEIAAEFEDKRWWSIKEKYRHETSKSLVFSDKLIRGKETIYDYYERTQGYDQVAIEKEIDAARSAESDRLNEIDISEATRVRA